MSFDILVNTLTSDK